MNDNKMVVIQIVDAIMCYYVFVFGGPINRLLLPATTPCKCVILKTLL